MYTFLFGPEIEIFHTVVFDSSSTVDLHRNSGNIISYFENLNKDMHFCRFSMCDVRDSNGHIS